MNNDIIIDHITSRSGFLISVTFQSNTETFRSVSGAISMIEQLDSQSVTVNNTYHLPMLKELSSHLSSLGFDVSC